MNNLLYWVSALACWLIPGDEIARLENAYVAVTGVPFEGVSIRMAGPEVVVATIEELADPVD